MLPADPFKWPTDGEVDLAESWNGETENHSCLHWGSYTGEDSQKHRVVKTHLPDLPRQPHTYGFAWIEEEGIPGWRGRMIWYIDGKAVMKGSIPEGTRRMEDFRILINIAMGGTVNQGKLPAEGYYDFVISISRCVKSHRVDGRSLSMIGAAHPRVKPCNQIHVSSALPTPPARFELSSMTRVVAFHSQ